MTDETAQRTSKPKLADLFGGCARCREYFGIIGHLRNLLRDAGCECDIGDGDHQWGTPEQCPIHRKRSAHETSAVAGFLSWIANAGEVPLRVRERARKMMASVETSAGMAPPMDTIAAICHATSGTCAHVLGSPGGPCDVSNCSAVRAYLGLAGIAQQDSASTSAPSAATEPSPTHSTTGSGATVGADPERQYAGDMDANGNIQCPDNGKLR